MVHHQLALIGLAHNARHASKISRPCECMRLPNTNRCTSLMLTCQQPIACVACGSTTLRTNDKTLKNTQNKCLPKLRLFCPTKIRLWQRSRRGSRTSEAEGKSKEKTHWATEVDPRLPRRRNPASSPSRKRYPRGTKSKDPAAQRRQR